MNAIVTIIGDMNHLRDEILKKADEMSREYIVYYPSKPERISFDEKRMKKKIEHSDSLFVYNKDRIIDEITMKYIQYAKSIGKSIVYLENQLQIITLCGNRKFKNKFLEVEKALTLQGNIVFSPSTFLLREGEIIDPLAIKMFEKIHREKINMSDEVYIINPEGYIDNDTNREIDYAIGLGKRITFLEGVKKDGINN